MNSLLKAIKKNRKEAIFAPLLKLIEAFFDLLVPIIVSIIIDKGINSNNNSIIIQYGIILIALALIGIIVAIIAQYFAAKVSIKVGSELRKNLIRKIEYLSLKNFEKQGRAKLINNMTNDTYQIQNGLNLFLRLALRSPLIVFGSCIAAFLIKKEIGFIFLAIIIIVALIIFVFSKIGVNKFKMVQQKKDHLYDITKDELYGAKEIRAFGLEENENNVFNEVNADLTQNQNVAYNISNLMNIFNYIIVNFGIIAILYFSAINVNVGYLTQGEVVALLNYCFQILVEIVKLANLLIIIPKAIVSSYRIDEVMKIESTNKKSILSVSDERNISLEFKDVCFSYAEDENKNALENISFKINEGETLGIIGSISSGKTTLVNLIERFYEATTGEILLNDMDINEYNSSFLRKNIALVSQDKAVFNDSIRNNILFGNKDLSDKNLKEVIDISELTDLINSKSEKLNANINEDGSNLSGGQAKRLMIARAVARNPKILVLDDAMSALDNLTELKVLYKLKEYSKNKIMILISQKINTVKNMDKILVLDNGKMVGYGKHSELLKSCKEYKEIYESQN